MTPTGSAPPHLHPLDERIAQQALAALNKAAKEKKPYN